MLHGRTYEIFLELQRHSGMIFSAKFVLFVCNCILRSLCVCVLSKQKCPLIKFRCYSGPHKSTLHRINLAVCEPAFKWFLFWAALKFTYNLYTVYTTSIQPWRTSFYASLTSNPLNWGPTSFFYSALQLTFSLQTKRFINGSFFSSIHLQDRLRSAHVLNVWTKIYKERAVIKRGNRNWMLR